MNLRRARRSGSVAVVALAFLGVLTSCGTSSTPSPTSPPGTATAPTTTAPTTAATPTAETAAEACEDAASLRSSLETLTKVRPTQDGLPALRAAITDVRTSLDAAEASASEVLKPDIEQVRTSFDELQTAASGLTADNIREKAPDIAAALRELATATQALTTTLRETCPDI
jgi:hypothetical protein